MKVNKIYHHLLLIMLTFSLTACLKDDERFSSTDLATKKIIELPSTSNLKAIALPYEDQNVELKVVTVALAAQDVASEDITVSLTMENSQKIINNFNAVNHKNMVELPSSFYTIKGSGLNVTIPKGSKTATFDVELNAIKFNPSATYAIGFNIAKVDKEGYTVSGNFDTILVTFGAKNKYDGVYNLSVRLDASDRPTLQTGVFSEWGGPVHLVTSSGRSVNLFDDWGFGINIQPVFTAAGGYTAFGQTNPKFTFDLATDKIVSVTNDAPTGSLNRRFEIDPDGPNYYDPVEKKIYASFIMTQTGFGPVKIKDVFTYVGSRP